MKFVLTEDIIYNAELAPDIYKLIFRSEYIAQNARPGQFVNIKCCEGINTILRRPISICDVDEKRITLPLYTKTWQGDRISFRQGR